MKVNLVVTWFQHSTGETQGTFPWFQSPLVYFFYNIVFDFITVDVFLEIFIAFESCNWLVLKNVFQGFVN